MTPPLGPIGTWLASALCSLASSVALPMLSWSTAATVAVGAEAKDGADKFHAACLRFVERRLGKRPVADVPWSSGMTMTFTGYDKAKESLQASSGDSSLDVPLRSIKTRDLANLIKAASGSEDAPDADGYILAAVLLLSDGDQSAASHLVERAKTQAAGVEDSFTQWLGLLDLEMKAPEAKPPPEPKKEPSEAELAKKQAAKGKVNHEGRLLPPLPAFNRTLLFNTPEADAVLASMELFPPDNAWNEDIAKRPVHTDSPKIIAAIGAKLHCTVEYGANYIIIPPKQPKIDVRIEYKGESDPGPYPIPVDLPVEGWPEFWTKNAPTLEQVQRVGEGDRHAVIIDPVSRMLYEFYNTRLTDAGWTAVCAAVYNLDSNKLRPDNWTSADAAGLAMMPGYIRFDELDRGLIDHALRMTVAKTRPEHIYPATHHAGLSKDPFSPAMGQRLRLKPTVDVSKFTKQAKAIAVALQKYGMIVADNGTDWALCATDDKRIDTGAMRELMVLAGDDFEVIVTTGEKEGPRARK